MKQPVEGQPSRVEILICISFQASASPEGTKEFKHCLCQCQNVLRVDDMTGNFDLCCEAFVDDLDEYQIRLDAIPEKFRGLIERYEIGIVTRRHRGHYLSGDSSPYIQSMWLPCSNAWINVSVRDIDQITAEQDYMRVHLGDKTYLINSTIKNLSEILDPAEFEQINRSTIVRKSFVAELEPSDRGLEARLKDGSTQHIPKARKAEVLHALLGQKKGG
jgi:two-component system, LytTR family, response regulator AlgR